MRRLILLLPLGLFAVPGGPPTAGPAPDRPPAQAPPKLDESAPLPSPEQLEALARSDVPAFLRACLLRYRREVKGYRAVLQKQERLGGKLEPAESIAVAFREDPFSVFLSWKTPPISMADRVLYVAGQSDGKALARGKFLGIVHSRDPYSPEAKAAGRYALPDFGIAKGTERTLRAWQAAHDRGKLKVEYRGVRPVAEAGNVQCYVLRRTCDPPEEDGVVSVEVAFDTERWLQVGNALTAAGNQLVAAYYFRDLVLNPKFPPDQFDRAALSRN